MSSTINASTASGGGLITSADASGILQLQTAGVTGLTIDGSQNVGIGTISPAAKLDVSTSINLGLSYLNVAYDIGGGSGWLGGYNVTYSAGVKNVATGTLSAASYQSGGVVFYTNTSSAAGTVASERMRIDASGNVGIGTSIPSSYGKLAISGNTSVIGGAGFYLHNTDNSAFAHMKNSGGTSVGQLEFYVGNVERMRIDSAGNLLVGTTSQFGSGKVCVSYDGTVYNGVSLRTTNAALNSNFVTFYNSATTNCGGISQNGTTTVNYITSSDYRLKENIIPIVGALDKVTNLNPVTYIWKDTDNEVGEGFIAHELQAICPLAVSGEKDAVNEDGSIKAQGIDPSKLVVLLTAAIQELKAIIDTQNARIEALEAK